MKKIIILGGNINNNGGTERASSLIANELSRHGYEIILASMVFGDRPFFELHENVKNISLFKSPSKIFFCAPKFFRLPVIISRINKMLATENADVLIAVDSMLTLFTIPATIGLQVKHICWEHFNFKNDNGRKLRQLARHLAARYCDVVVTLTERDRKFWLRHTSHKAQFVTIPNPSPFEVQHGHEPPINSCVVLAVGRLVPVKGFDLLLAAWRKVSPNVPGWRLRILGDGPDRDALAKVASDYGIEDSVDFVEATSDVKRHYIQAEIYCLSSRFEGFPMVLLEAISFGLPVVSFDCDTGPAEILAGTESLLVPTGDVTSLSDALLRLIRAPKERRRISALSKSKAASYQPEAIIGRWLELLES